MKRINENCEIDKTKIIGAEGISNIYIGRYQNE